MKEETIDLAEAVRRRSQRPPEGRFDFRARRVWWLQHSGGRPRRIRVVHTRPWLEVLADDLHADALASQRPW